MQRFNLDWGIDDVLGAMGLRRKSQVTGLGSFFLGLGIGVVGGVAATMLLTPYTGTQAREKLLRAGEDLGKNVTGKVEELTRGLKGERGTISANTQNTGTRTY